MPSKERSGAKPSKEKSSAKEKTEPSTPVNRTSLLMPGSSGFLMACTATCFAYGMQWPDKIGITGPDGHFPELDPAFVAPIIGLCSALLLKQLKPNI